ncbi:MAG: TonB-dependent receptor [Terriglobia bacterium]|nr:TonB-dependent receptor [Terriglobia bacterium]
MPYLGRIPRVRLALVLFGAPSILLLTLSAFAQGAGSSGTVGGKVLDPSGAVVAGATVNITNPVSGYSASTESGSNGQYIFQNVPFNNYHMTATHPSFKDAVQDVIVRSSVPVSSDLSLSIANTETVTVEEHADLVENEPVAHTDIDRDLYAKLPTESVNSPMSSLVTLSTPGIAADSNGLFHPLGEHADASFSVDGQPITDQQSRVFSNQLPVNAVESMEIINGVVPPEYGDKPSLIIRTTTRSGLNSTPHGSISASYGSFGTTNSDIALGFGNKRFGNFVAIDGVNSGRYLDTPEFQPLHDHGNGENLFDRIDFQPSPVDSIHLNLGLSRSWFQTPNQYDQQALGQDQRAKILSYNASLVWTHMFGSSMLLSVNPYLRQDQFHYYPSADPFHDQTATLSQSRRLQNAGLKTNFSYSKGIHNLKAGIEWYHTFLAEGFETGITDPAFNPVCLDINGAPITDPSVLDAACAGPGQQVNPNFVPGLLSLDLTRGGSLFQFRGHTDVKQLAGYLQDNISWRNWTFLVGARAETYNGLTSRSQFEPRLGVSYLVKPTSTVLRLGYARLMPTPYNENLIISSATGNILGAAGDFRIRPAVRDQYNAGFQQAFGKYALVNAEYFWKYTQGDYDFDLIFNTPVTFPIQWKKSKIDGFGIKVSMPAYHGLSAYSVLGHTRSRFFGPEVGGLFFNNADVIDATVFRIDHDQAFEETTHLQYQPKPNGPWLGFNWRYESGLVAGSAPFSTNPDPLVPVDLTALSADQQAQIELTCNGVRATLTSPLSGCPGSSLTSPLVRIPAPGTENDDKNPPRINPRHMFDLAVGWDNLLRHDRYRTNLTFTVVNLTDKYALYNFLSTFSGTHFVGPRSYTAQLVVEF